MSYCRWSCDNFKSDVYVYDDVGGGWTTMVADNSPKHRGETFNDKTIRACVKRLLSLRKLGCHVPQHAIDRLRNEMHNAGRKAKTTMKAYTARSRRHKTRLTAEDGRDLHGRRVVTVNVQYLDLKTACGIYLTPKQSLALGEWLIRWSREPHQELT